MCKRARYPSGQADKQKEAGSGKPKIAQKNAKPWRGACRFRCGAISPRVNLYPENEHSLLSNRNPIQRALPRLQALLQQKEGA